MQHTVSIFLVSFLVAVSPINSIMVDYGTRQGPIVPPPSTTVAPLVGPTRSPAPVYEDVEDVPNPNPYRPIDPVQYRNNIYNARPNPNLILGTPLDQKFSRGPVNYYEKQPKSQGLDYRGPQSFGHYQADDYRYKSRFLTNKEIFQERIAKKLARTNMVPAIAIIYSSGVRYYVPIFQYTQHVDQEVNTNHVA